MAELEASVAALWGQSCSGEGVRVHQAVRLSKGLHPPCRQLDTAQQAAYVLEQLKMQRMKLSPQYSTVRGPQRALD